MLNNAQCCQVYLRWNHIPWYILTHQMLGRSENLRSNEAPPDEPRHTYNSMASLFLSSEMYRKLKILFSKHRKTYIFQDFLLIQSNQ